MLGVFTILLSSNCPILNSNSPGDGLSFLIEVKSGYRVSFHGYLKLFKGACHTSTLIIGSGG
jgi:hypothetical protein